jgi:4-hydroxybenzoyl-CoA reductase subunit beta
MLPLPRFSLETPDTLDQALGLMTEDGARLLAGGTDLLPSMKHRLFRPGLLVSVRRVEALRGIRAEDGGLSIGAACTLDEVARDPRVRQGWPALADACRTVATSTIQAMGTLGGNVMLDTRCLYYNQPAGWRESIGGCLKADGSVCHVARTGTGCYAAQSADTVPALWLYGARLHFQSVDFGQRVLPLARLFGPDGRTWLRTANGEVLTRIELPGTAGGRVAHRKLRPRGSIDYGSLLVAVQRHGDSASCVIGAVGPQPIEVQADRAEDLPERAWAAARPLNTHSWSTTWRKHMVRVEVKRALAALAEG